MRRTAHLLVVTFLLPALVSADDAGFRPIFDGKTLDGWQSADMGFWSVEDGALTARSSAERPCRKNQFLVWQGGLVDDFELKLEFRILGTPRANSGIQIRSQIAADGHASGYQADLDRAGRWRGALYDEHTGRGMLAAPGEKTVISESGERTTAKLDSAPPSVDPEGWSSYHIAARGERIVLRVNGAVTADVTDRERAHRDLWGHLALQLHAGPPMTVQFKDIQLKRLSLSDGRRKIVLLAGAPSHGSGEHEHNAGIRLLTRRLQKLDGVVATSYHDGGWPKDPTAFDNANGVVLYSDGGGRHPFVPHLDEFAALMERGVGLLCMHYAVEVPKGKAGDLFKKWIGGHYESGYSSNPHWDADLAVNASHPIGRGVENATIHDEWYFSIRFRDGMKGVTSVFQAKPSDKTRSKNGYPPKPYPHIIDASGKVETLLWAVERPDGGRGAGFTGGHWHRNWAYDTQRRAVLNAILWISGADVPEGGVESAPVSEEELNRDMDRKRKMVRVELPPAS